ncbi:hypothetical protein MKS83_04080 [Chryseobacterium sp. Y16C]|uniref:hypothetical protein n=1 Tax=Chryseobacterium sp. Y16C TaxID=2920939 RepID=UPI001F0A47BE|nr:hypothetical protein [Chryseobacterium sp. Y16C]UMQ42870.1 hypothetical protein MKS83_04080 [Chryseobacterium sp. Y16C]
MKYLIIICLVIGNTLFSQEISKDEYIIYAQVLNELNFPSDKFHLGLSNNEKASLLISKDPIESKIGELNSEKTFNLSRLDSCILKFRQDRSLNYHKKDKWKDYKIKLTCSDIYFKSDSEAYVYGIDEFRDLKPMQFLFKATKEKDGYWHFEDYTFYY